MAFDSWQGQAVGLLRSEVEASLRACEHVPQLVTWCRQALSQPGRVFSEQAGTPWSGLPLLVCEAAGGPWEKTSPAAAAIELWLAAGDVLDEVEDRDEAGLWQVAGAAQAANAGTALLFLTQQAVMRLLDRGFSPGTVLRIAREIAGAGVRSCAGQHLDLLYESRAVVTEGEYFEMTSLRSGSLIECACRVGAIAAGVGEERVAAFSAAGRHMGVYAQVLNDIRSLEVERGKSDVMRGKKTLPVVYALHRAEGPDRVLLDRVLGGGVACSAGEREAFRALLERLGAVHYASLVADIYRQKAVRAMCEAGAGESVVERLKELLTA